MSAIETKIKDVVQRTDADPLELSVRYNSVDSQDEIDTASGDSDSGNDEVEARPGEVILVDTANDPDDADPIGGAVNVNLPDPAPANSKVIVKKLADNANTVTVAAPGDNSIDEGSQSLGSQYDSVTVISDGDQYYVV